jgi:hypothetical protein
LKRADDKKVKAEIGRAEDEGRRMTEVKGEGLKAESSKLKEISINT